MNKRIYIIQSTKYFKVGISSKPLARLRTLQIGNPEKMSLVKSYESPSGISTDLVEARIHDDLKEFNVHGEWFDCPLSFVKESIQRITELSKAEIYREIAKNPGAFGNKRVQKHRKKEIKGISAAVALRNYIDSENPEFIAGTEDTITLLMTGACGIKRRTLEAAGEPWPPHRGWKKRLIGKLIPVQVFKNALDLKGIS